ncbi:MAG: NirA family protein [Verrucomicrobiota bacterium]
MVNLNDSGFSSEQTNYLKAFVSGLTQGQALPHLGQDAEGRFTHDEEETVHGTPVDELCKEETFKHEQHGLDCYDTILANATSGVFPDGGDVFRFKFHGLFYVAPAQDSFMMRARIAGGKLHTLQFRGFADMTRDWGNGFCDITTRNNLQIREILPPNAPKVLEKLIDLGLTAQGSGADNVRNITATPTTGFDPEELIDVMPYAKATHHYILKNRDLYGLPRKFNISYDSGGCISVCADTNDIGYYAVKVNENDDGIEPGVYFRLQLCGITGHKQFASDTGLLLTPEETIPVSAAILRVFIENGCRTNRNKARLKYLVDDWGVEKLLAEAQKKLTFDLRSYDLAKCEESQPKVKHGHLGVHRQSDGSNYIGVCIPVGRMNAEKMHQLADVAERFGKSEIRLTVWQNLLIPHVSDENLEAAKAAIAEAGFSIAPATVTGGLIACTGSRGCKYAAADTKGNAVHLGEYLRERVPLDQPINLHLTGCKHSCAQHYIGDIGMVGAPVKNEAGETVDGYSIVLGGGCDDTQAVAREIINSLAYTDIPPLIENLLNTYLAERVDRETFAVWSNRQDLDRLKEILSPVAA